MDLRTTLGNIKVANRLKGLVDVSAIQQGLVGQDTLVGKTLSGDLLSGSPLEKAVETFDLDFEGVFESVIGLASGDVEGFVWSVIEPFVSLLPLIDPLGEGFGSTNNYVFGSTNYAMEEGLHSIVSEQAFLDTLIGLEDAKIEILFEKGLGILGELVDIISVKASVLGSVRSGVTQVLSNVVPVKLNIIRELFPFLFTKLTVLDNILGIIEAKTMESVGVNTSRKQSMSLLQYASKVAPMSKVMKECESGQCNAHRKEFLEELLAPGLVDIIGTKVDIKEIILQAVPLTEAAGFLIDVVSGIPDGLVTKLEVISGLDPVSIISLFTAAASQLPVVGDDISQALSFKVGAKEAIVQLFRSESLSGTNLVQLVEGFQILDLSDLGSLIATKGGFLTDTLDSVLTSQLLDGGLINESDHAQLINFDFFGGINKFKIGADGASGEIGVVSLEGFPGGLQAFQGLLEEASFFMEAYEALAGFLQIDNLFDIESFAEMAVGLIGDVKMTIFRSPFEGHED